MPTEKNIKNDTLIESEYSFFLFHVVILGIFLFAIFFSMYLPFLFSMHLQGGEKIF